MGWIWPTPSDFCPVFVHEPPWQNVVPPALYQSTATVPAARITRQPGIVVPLFFTITVGTSVSDAGRMPLGTIVAVVAKLFESLVQFVPLMAPSRHVTCVPSCWYATAVVGDVSHASSHVIVKLPVTALTPVPAGVPQVPSPRQNVVALALVPLFRFVTGRLPVAPVARLTVGASHVAGDILPCDVSTSPFVPKSLPSWIN